MTEKTEKKETSEKVEQKREKKLLTEKRIALFLAIVLVLLSVIAVVRNSNVLGDMKNGIAGWFSSSEKKDEKTGEESKKDEKSDESSDAKQEEKDNTSTSNSGVQAHTFTAAAGDSFTGFARTAIAEYATTEKLQLSDAQKLAAEVSLVNAAGAPLLEVGQKVEIAPEKVVAALEVAGVVATSSTSTSKDETAASTKDFTATAVAGDSYTGMARQAVAKADGGLSAAQKVAAETFLAEAAGFPRLEIGQAVTIKASDIAQAVARAKALTASELAAWEYWANEVRF
jgi:flagellar biosynthesis component FlhA